MTAMDTRSISITNEEAKRIKELVAEEFMKLRESLSFSEVNEDNIDSNTIFSYDHSVDHIEEPTTEVCETFSVSKTPVQSRRGLTKYKGSAKRSKEIYVENSSRVSKITSCSHKKNENEKFSSATNNCCYVKDRTRYGSIGLPTCSTSNPEVNSDINSLNNNGYKNSNKYVESLKKYIPLSSTNKIVNQPGRDFSPLIIDCNYTDSRTSAVIPSSNFSENIQESPPEICETPDFSNSLECLSDSDISVIVCENRDRQKEASETQSNKTNSWENFVAHLIAVQKNNNFRDLFTQDDVNIMREFSCLGMAAQTAFVHLLNSKFIWFRESALVNSEMIHELKPLIDILIEKKFLIENASSEEIGFLIELLSVPELRQLCIVLGLRSDGSRKILSESILTLSNKYRNVDKGKSEKDQFYIKEKILNILGRLVKLNHNCRELFLRTQLLFALPLSKTVKVDGRIPLIAVMNDVSERKVIYPDYSMEPLHKIFSSRISLIGFQQALVLEANIKSKMKSKDFDGVISLYETAIIQFQEELRDENASEYATHLPNYLRTFTRGTALASAVHHSVEGLQKKRMHNKMISAYETLLSQDLYLKSYRGIWYDRLAQIYQNIMKDISKTVVFLTEALVDPSLNFIDRVLLSKRASPIVRVKRKRKSESEMYEELKSMLCVLKEVQEVSINASAVDGVIEKERKISYVYETEEGVGQILSTPEEVIMLHFKQFGYGHGVHAPNGIGSSVFGILFWDIIYNIKVPNVFLCPYQTIPLDITSGEFYANRERQINTRLIQIKELWNDQEMDDHILKTWTEEVGKKSLVSWETFENLDQFKVILKCIGRRLIAKICEKMAKDFHLLQKGFPSLILLNRTTKNCKFIQVKEPDSHLTPSQKSWLLHLSTAGGDAFACYINTVGSKTLKRKLDVMNDSMALEDSMELDIF